MSSPDAPVAISVVIASYNARATIEQSLAALCDQSTDAVYEVIVVDSSNDGTAEVVARSHPEVKLIRCFERRFAGHARNIGIGVASGEILALTDVDCVVAHDWIESILLAHERRQTVIGGVVDNANPESTVGWGYYFCEFNKWRPGAREGFVDDIPGCCLTLKRSAFEQWGPFLEGTYSSDTAFHWRMAADGERPFLDPTLRVGHINPTRLGGQWRHEVLHGRQFARVRAAEQRLGVARLSMLCALAPVLPFALFARALQGFRSDRTHLGLFILTSPIVLASLIAWCYGELCGYLGVLLSKRGIEA